MNYAMLSRCSIQSLSDQSDYRKLAVIAAAAPSAVTPEQCGVWSYPSRDSSPEEVAFNMVNALLLRVHQSGDLAGLPPESFALVREGLDYYKSIRHDIPKSIPFWPLGLPSFDDEWISLGLKCNDKAYLAVWRLGSQNDTCSIPIEIFKDREIAVRCGYPANLKASYWWNKNSGILTMKLPGCYTARIFEISVL